MYIILGCEESQAVCKEFRKLGYNAFSCDLLPCSGGHPEWHLQMDIFKAIKGGRLKTQAGNFVTIKKWDQGIFFPPCTHLATSGAKHFAKKRENGSQQEAIRFFIRLWESPIRRIAIENPVGIMGGPYLYEHFPQFAKHGFPRKPDQIIHPWWFGDPHTKQTCLWLKGLPKLQPTNIVDKGKRHTTKSGKSLPEWYNLPPGPDRAKIRSKTFEGISEAMANQWGQIQ